MMNENIISLNVPNIVTIGIIIAIWGVIFVVTSQVVRKVQANASGS